MKDYITLLFPPSTEPNQRKTCNDKLPFPFSAKPLDKLEVAWMDQDIR